MGQVSVIAAKAIRRGKKPTNGIDVIYR